MVNTFITYSDLKKNFKILDYKRLGKQRLEAKQILNVLEGKQEGYKNHPIVKMWQDHIPGLKVYLNYCIDEWVSRGYNNTMQKETIDLSENDVDNEIDLLPWWCFNKQVQNTHKASLIRKDPDYYIPKFQDFDMKKYIIHGYIWTNRLDTETKWKLYNNEELELSNICDKPNIPIPDKISYM